MTTAASPPSAAPATAPRVTAVIICGNERAQIEACLDSVAWCDEIVVVDSNSTDGTWDLARARTPHVYRQAWLGFTGQRNFADDRATGDWILSLDADERCTPELAAEIRTAIANPGDNCGFWVKCHIFYLGAWINHSGWYPGYKCHLYRRDVSRWVGDYIHEHVEVQGPTGRLKSDLIHYTFRNFSAQIKKLDSYTDLQAAELQSRGKRTGVVALTCRPIGKFIEVYLIKRGILDGMPGFIIAVASSFYMFTRLVKLWELQHGTTAPLPPPSPAASPSAAPSDTSRPPVADR